MATSNSRLKYRIARCTSEEPDFPVSELLAHSQQTKGWQTARHCDFPQEVCLQFDSPVHLRQVQFLSHQSKIATRIELFTGMAPIDFCQLEAVQFKRLGYLSLDNNERSQFQARELKSVYVDVVAQFLRIVFHRCHVNRYNAHNQVGLIALSCLGEVLSSSDVADKAPAIPSPKPSVSPTTAPTTPVAPTTPLAPTPPVAPTAPMAPSSVPIAPVVAPVQEIPVAETQSVPDPPEPPPTRASPKTVQPPVNKVASDFADMDESKYDVKTLERLKSLVQEKQKCVEAEDYGGAKRCKEAIVMLKKAGLRICELEEQKKSAVENEEYDVAKSLKAEIDRLRQQCEGVEEKETKVEPSLSTPALSVQQEAIQKPSPPRRAQHRTSYPKAAPAARSMIPPDDEAKAVPQGPSAPLQPKGGSRSVGGYRVAAEAAPLAEEMPVTPSIGSTAKPKSAEKNGVRGDGFKPDFNGKIAEIDTTFPSNGAAHPEDGQPEPIPPNQQAEAEALCSAFGLHTIQCIFSKNWSFRDSALQKLATELRERQDAESLMSAYVAILMRTIPDKNVQVFHSSAVLLQALCHLAETWMDRGDLQAALEPLLPLLAERLGDANARAEKTARDVHLDLARSVGAGFSAQHLQRAPKKKTVPPRVYSSRLQLLASLVTEFGVQPKNPEGLPLEPVAQLAMEWFSNPAAEVRENAVRLIAACYAHVGLGRIEKYLANLRQAQREVFDAEFQHVNGQNGLSKMVSPPPAPHAPAAPVPPRAPVVAAVKGAEAMTFPDAGGYSDEDFDEGFHEFRCEFCGREDPNFTLPALDIHYWRECPMLSACQFCEQVIEISRLHWHWLEECEKDEVAIAHARRLHPDRCPLCQGRVCRGVPEEQDWQEHLLVMGCPCNPRGRQSFR